MAIFDYKSGPGGFRYLLLTLYILVTGSVVASCRHVVRFSGFVCLRPACCEPRPGTYAICELVYGIILNNIVFQHANITHVDACGPYGVASGPLISYFFTLEPALSESSAVCSVFGKEFIMVLIFSACAGVFTETLKNVSPPPLCRRRGST